MIPRPPEPERGLVLAVLAQGREPDDELAEVEELARTAGVEPVGRVVQHRPRPARRTYVGKGKLEELKERFASSRAESLLVDVPSESRAEQVIAAVVRQAVPLPLAYHEGETLHYATPPSIRPGMFP